MSYILYIRLQQLKPHFIFYRYNSSRWGTKDAQLECIYHLQRALHVISLFIMQELTGES